MIKRAAILLLIVNFGMIAYAQQPTVVERQKILLGVVEAMENYKRYASMDRDFYSYKDMFVDLFVSEDAMISNDLMGLASTDKVTVKEYAELLSEMSVSTRIEIKNIRYESLYNEDGQWKVACSFDKYVNVTNECDVEFSSDFLNKADFSMRAVLVYLPETEYDSTTRCVFENIETKTVNQSMLPEGYKVFIKSDARDSIILVDGKKLEFNVLDQAFISANPVFKYNDYDVKLRLEPFEQACNKYKMTYKPIRNKVRVHFDYVIGDAYKIEGADALETKTTMMEAGIDYGYTFPSKGKVKTSFNIGLMYSTSTIELALPETSYRYNAAANADIDGDTYTRVYENVKANEKITLNSIAAPVYFDFDFKVASRFSFFIQAGAKAYYNLEAVLNECNFDGYVYGLYSKYNNLRLDEQWGGNGFGTIHRELNYYESEELPVNSFSVDAFGGAGFRIEIIKQRCVLEVGATYQMGVMEAWKAEDRKLNFTGTVSSSANTLSNYTTQDGEKTYMLNTTFSKLNRNHLKAHGALIFKF